MLDLPRDVNALQSEGINKLVSFRMKLKQRKFKNKTKQTPLWYQGKGEKILQMMFLCSLYPCFQSWFQFTQCLPAQQPALPWSLGEFLHPPRGLIRSLTPLCLGANPRSRLLACHTSQPSTYKLCKQSSSPREKKSYLFFPKGSVFKATRMQHELSNEKSNQIKHNSEKQVTEQNSGTWWSWTLWRTAWMSASGKHAGKRAAFPTVQPLCKCHPEASWPGVHMTICRLILEAAHGKGSIRRYTQALPEGQGGHRLKDCWRFPFTGIISTLQVYCQTPLQHARAILAQIYFGANTCHCLVCFPAANTVLLSWKKSYEIKSIVNEGSVADTSDMRILSVLRKYYHVSTWRYTTTTGTFTDLM